jgi:outer membrane receptor protein involved in Fe transport
LLSGVVFRRENDTDSFNGDASEFELCEFAGGAQALLEDADEIEESLEEQLGIELDDICAGEEAAISSFDLLEAYIEEQALLAGLDAEDFELENVSDDLSGSGLVSDEAINNISNRKQRSEGLEGQVTFLADLGGLNNRLMAGFSFFSGVSRFRSVTELAGLDPVTRSTLGLGTGTFFDEAATDIRTETETWGLYFTNTLDLSEDLSLTLAGRFNRSEVNLRDRSGERPELNGKHRFSRFNPSVGLAWQVNEVANVYLSYSESSRVPTPIELSCNDAIFAAAQARLEAQGEDPGDVEFECRLPNAFLADPPLDDVKTRHLETGIRGQFAALNYQLGLFRADNEDDIIFQTTGRATGLFANVDRTRRQGFESTLSGNQENFDWLLSYSFTDATYQDDFLALSPNHPSADDDGNIQVRPGDDIPGIPRHQLKLNGGYRFANGLLVGAEALYNSGQTLRGDESNQLGDVAAFTVVNLRALYPLSDSVSLFARITNLFDTAFESFGLLGEDPAEVLDFLGNNTPVFLGAGAPRGIWIGARIRF